jgi:hypothetical protein
MTKLGSVTKSEQALPAEISASKESRDPLFLMLGDWPRICSALFGMNDTTLTIRCPYCTAGGRIPSDGRL